MPLQAGRLPPGRPARHNLPPMSESRVTLERLIGDDANLEPPAEEADIVMLRDGLRAAGLPLLPDAVTALLRVANGIDFGVGRISGIDGLPPRVGGMPYPDLYDLNKQAAGADDGSRFFVLGDSEGAQLAYDTSVGHWVERDPESGEVYEAHELLSALILSLLEGDRPLDS